MLTHIDKDNQPSMVTVSDKAVTKREATAATRIQLPPEVARHLSGREIQTKKGPVFATAIVAGTMAVKRTHDLIPFCHPLPIEGCKFTISPLQANAVVIECTVKTTNKTGVEMEALTGATVAALTVYDMCKALSHEIVLGETRLLHKSGGKNEYRHKPEEQ